MLMYGDIPKVFNDTDMRAAQTLKCQESVSLWNSQLFCSKSSNNSTNSRSQGLPACVALCIDGLGSISLHLADDWPCLDENSRQHRTPRWEVMKYKYYVTLLKCNFPVQYLYFYFYSLDF